MERQLELDGAELTEWLPHPPDELFSAPLRRLGEGVGKVVYASQHWVVKRDRSPSEVVAIIVLWNFLRKLKRVLPGGWVDAFLRGPSKEIRLLRVLVQAAMMVVPKSIWFTRHIRKAWTIYISRDRRGRRLAEQHLKGTSLIPETVTFPPSSVRVAGWPGWLTVTEATERVECTLNEKLAKLAAAGNFDEVEEWLNHFLELRQSGWSRGLFSMDAHLKNFGVCGERVVLLDTGGLTNRWTEIMDTLAYEENVTEPHVRLGLGDLLEERPDIAARFNARWKATVNSAAVRDLWPTPPDHSQ
jgi:hypothetical protein